MNIDMLTDHEFEFLVSRLERLANVDEVGMSDLVEEDVCEGDVEIRLFPGDEENATGGPPAVMNIDVIVREEADWYEELGVYSADNLRNGGPMYERLADEMHDVVVDGLGVTDTEFVCTHGSDVFSAEVDL